MNENMRMIWLASKMLQLENEQARQEGLIPEHCPRCGSSTEFHVHGYCGNSNCRHYLTQPVTKSGGVNEL